MSNYWKSHSTLPLLATQDLPTFLYYMIDPLKSWCWGAILF
ncbi:integrase, partial [Phocaeicola vulgatus]